MMTKDEFRKVFDECMKVNKAHDCQVDDDGNVYHSDIDVEPSIIIRDFDVDTTRMEESGVWDSEETDKVFKVFEKAWAYFELTFPMCRVMDSSGKIYFDYYDYCDRKDTMTKDYTCVECGEFCEDEGDSELQDSKICSTCARNQENYDGGN